MSDFLREHIRLVPDFPKPGVGFFDISPLLQSGEAFNAATEGLARSVAHLDVHRVIAAEAKGYIFGGAIARQLGVGLALARKPGKLPHEIAFVEYDLEYGSDRLEVHRDAITPGMRVLVHDELLATGGTAKAMCDLVEDLGGTVVACNFLVELGFLPGRQVLEGYDVHSLLRYDTE